MTRVLIFCGTREAQLRYLDDCVPMFTSPGFVDWFHRTPDAVATVGRSWATGWRAPEGTVIVFDKSWPYEERAPETVQARMRVPREAPTSSPELWAQTRLLDDPQP